MVRQTSASFTPPAAEEDVDDRLRSLVIDLLSPSPAPVDEIVRQAAVPAALIQTVLLELEIGGRLERHAGGRVSLAA